MIDNDAIALEHRLGSMEGKIDSLIALAVKVGEIANRVSSIEHRHIAEDAITENSNKQSQWFSRRVTIGAAIFTIANGILAWLPKII